jgi:hypothetical protein
MSYDVSNIMCDTSNVICDIDGAQMPPFLEWDGTSEVL